eukprot:9290382-Alexandrium_andersonii.AAC.1
MDRGGPEAVRAPVPVNPGGHVLGGRFAASVQLPAHDAPPGGPEVREEGPVDGGSNIVCAHPMPVPLLQEDQVPGGVL